MSRKIISFLVLIVMGAITVSAALNLQYIQDVISYRQYQPDATVASFASKSGMSEQGKFLFFVSQPSLEGPETFNLHCSKTEITTAILGCYDGRKIYIYNIEDERLAGIRPTTAAHEMLHAAYRRLNSSERQRVDALLNAEYERLVQDGELSDRMAFYERTQPGERENELHSIIGTEIKDISPALEEYYKKYFSDRSMVIAQRQQYYSVFKELRERADTLSRQIDAMEQSITSDRSAYNGAAASLQTSISAFNARASSGGFESQSAFSRERQALLARSAELDALRIKINNAITEYNRLASELNEIAIETEELNRSIDSHLAPAPQLQEQNG